MIYRIVTRGAQGEIKITDYSSPQEILKRYVQAGIEEFSTCLELRGFPIFHGLIGPIPDHLISDYQEDRYVPRKNNVRDEDSSIAEENEVARYETPEIFEKITKIWSASKRKNKKLIQNSKQKN